VAVLWRLVSRNGGPDPGTWGDGPVAIQRQFGKACKILAVAHSQRLIALRARPTPPPHKACRPSSRQLACSVTTLSAPQFRRTGCGDDPPARGPRACWGIRNAKHPRGFPWSFASEIPTQLTSPRPCGRLNQLLPQAMRSIIPASNCSRSRVDASRAPSGQRFSGACLLANFFPFVPLGARCAPRGRGGATRIECWGLHSFSASAFFSASAGSARGGNDFVFESQPGGCRAPLAAPPRGLAGGDRGAAAPRRPLSTCRVPSERACGNAGPPLLCGRPRWHRQPPGSLSPPTPTQVCICGREAASGIIEALEAGHIDLSWAGVVTIGRTMWPAVSHRK